MKNVTQKPVSLFPDNDEAVWVRRNEARTDLQTDLNAFDKLLQKFFFNYLMGFSTG